RRLAGRATVHQRVLCHARLSRWPVLLRGKCPDALSGADFRAGRAGRRFLDSHGGTGPDQLAPVRAGLVLLAECTCIDRAGPAPSSFPASALAVASGRGVVSLPGGWFARDRSRPVKWRRAPWRTTTLVAGATRDVPFRSPGAGMARLGSHSLLVLCDSAA